MHITSGICTQIVAAVKVTLMPLYEMIPVLVSDEKCPNKRTLLTYTHVHVHMYLTHGLNLCKYGRVCSLFWSPLCHFSTRINHWEGKEEGQEEGIEEGKSEGEKEGERERGSKVFTSMFPECQGMKEGSTGRERRMDEGREGGREGIREGEGSRWEGRLREKKRRDRGRGPCTC